MKMNVLLTLILLIGQASAASVSQNGIGELVQKARAQGRGLEQEEEDGEVDISGYSIKFEQCQVVKQLNSEDRKNEDGVDNTFETKRFVVFRLCPDNSCSSCDSNYGEYVVDMETYLESTLKYKEEQQENYCRLCDESCGGDDDNDGSDDSNLDCDSCYNFCQKMENMEENGYVDASEYAECQKIYESQDDDGEEVAYYAGPICAYGGTAIKIGAFYDEDCSVYAEDIDVENYIGRDNDGDGDDDMTMQLSYNLLKNTFMDGECIAPCLSQDDNQEDEQDDDQVQVSEVCQQLYESSAKCESYHGMESGIATVADNYANQISQESLVCDYISSLQSGIYDQYGELSEGSSQLYGNRYYSNNKVDEDDIQDEIVIRGSMSFQQDKEYTTGTQKFALVFFGLGSVGLAFYAVMLHSYLTQGQIKPHLSEQGEGAMA